MYFTTESLTLKQRKKIDYYVTMLFLASIILPVAFVILKAIFSQSALSLGFWGYVLRFSIAAVISTIGFVIIAVNLESAGDMPSPFRTARSRFYSSLFSTIALVLAAIYMFLVAFDIALI